MRGWMERAGRLMRLAYNRNEGTFVAEEQRHPSLQHDTAATTPVAARDAGDKRARTTSKRGTK